MGRTGGRGSGTRLRREAGVGLMDASPGAMFPAAWRGGRAVQCTGLENRRPKGLVGSNPTPSVELPRQVYLLQVFMKTPHRHVPQYVPIDERE